MMACHAVVQRILAESLGILPSPGGSRILPAAVLNPPAQLDMCPNFADDGFLAGESSEVLRALQHCKQIMPSLGLRFSSLIVAPAVSANCAVDMSQFLAEGCAVAESGNFEVLKSPCGNADHCKDFCMTVARKHSKTFEALSSLEDSHVAYYLLRWSANASRMTYVSRTTPLADCGPALEIFDNDVRKTFVEVSGLPLDDDQWIQATFNTKQGGLGLRSAAAVAHAAYL